MRIPRTRLYTQLNQAACTFDFWIYVRISVFFHFNLPILDLKIIILFQLLQSFRGKVRLCSTDWYVRDASTRCTAHFPRSCTSRIINIIREYWRWMTGATHTHTTRLLLSFPSVRYEQPRAAGRHAATPTAPLLKRLVWLRLSSSASSSSIREKYQKKKKGRLLVCPTGQSGAQTALRLSAVWKPWRRVGVTS